MIRSVFTLHHNTRQWTVCHLTLNSDIISCCFKEKGCIFSHGHVNWGRHLHVNAKYVVPFMYWYWILYKKCLIVLWTLSRSTWKQHVSSSRTLKKMVPWRMFASFSILPMIQRKTLFSLHVGFNKLLVSFIHFMEVQICWIKFCISTYLLLAIITETTFKLISAVLSVSSLLAWHWLQQSSWHTSVKTMSWLFLLTWALMLRLCERYVVVILI